MKKSDFFEQKAKKIKHCEYYGSKDSFVRMVFQNRIEDVATLFKKINKYEYKILDIGTGEGYVLRKIHEINPNVVATDISSERLNQIDFTQNKLVCDATELPMDSSSFDVVLCTSVLDHIPDYHKCINEITRVLKPQGYLLLNFNNFLFFIKLQTPDNLGHFQFFSYWTIRKLLKEKGFKVLEKKGNGFPCGFKIGEKVITPYFKLGRTFLKPALNKLGQLLPWFSHEVTMLLQLKKKN
jgi:ubiquinone/menaquinone biosynthesis C-methylase UbiE